MFTIRIPKPNFKRSAVLLATLACMGVVLAACNNKGPATPTDSQQTSQQVVEDYQHAAESQVPYPSAQMIKGGWLERTLLVENLLRQNNTKRLAYVTLLNQQGQPIIQFTIQGMVFSLNSQLTTEDKLNYSGCGTNCGNAVTTKSPGDNGTWGPEPDGIGFFTTQGVEIKWNGLYLESDSPLDITTKPLIVYNVDTAKPSVSAGGVSSVADGGIKIPPTPPTTTATGK